MTLRHDSGIVKTPTNCKKPQKIDEGIGPSTPPSLSPILFDGNESDQQLFNNSPYKSFSSKVENIENSSTAKNCKNSETATSKNDVSTKSLVYFTQKLSKFHDNVHGDMNAIHPVIMSMIDTPIFKRLKDLHQLGLANHVYQTATHKRFEHSIGVSYLAGKFCRKLFSDLPPASPDPKRWVSKSCYADDDIEKHVLLVSIAGLLHDIGHGPFSHLWDDYIVNNDNDDWTHEKGSCLLFDKILEDPDVKKLCQAYNIDNAADINFVKECIDSPGSTIEKNGEWLFKSRSKKYAWMFEIVSNKRCGIDVDRLDYLIRDAKITGMSHEAKTALERYMENTRINMHPQFGIPIITVNKSDVSIYHDDLFQLRMKMHKKVYQHPVVSVVETMMKDVLLGADRIQQYFDPKAPLLSQYHKDMNYYSKLTESVVAKIEDTPDGQFEKSKRLLWRIAKRKLYKEWVAIGPIDGRRKVAKMKADQIENEILKMALEKYSNHSESTPQIDCGNKNVQKTIKRSLIFQNNLNNETPVRSNPKRAKKDANHDSGINAESAENLDQSFQISVNIVPTANNENNDNKNHLSILKPYFEIKRCKIHQGSGNEDPLKNIYYFEKNTDQINSGEKLSHEFMTLEEQKNPPSYCKVYFKLYYKGEEDEELIGGFEVEKLRTILQEVFRGYFAQMT